MREYFIFRVEFLDDPENKIVRPRQNYTGYSKRDYISFEDRKQVEISYFFSKFNIIE